MPTLYVYMASCSNPLFFNERTWVVWTTLQWAFEQRHLIGCCYAFAFCGDLLTDGLPGEGQQRWSKNPKENELRPWKLTWNQQKSPKLKRKIIFQTSIFRFHVNLNVTSVEQKNTNNTWRIIPGLGGPWLITMVIVVVPSGSGCGTPSKWPFHGL